MNTTNAPSELPLSGSALSDGAEAGQPAPCLPDRAYWYAFGYSYQGMCAALSMLRGHQYDRAIDQLSRTCEGMERIKAGLDPEATK